MIQFNQPRKFNHSTVCNGVLIWGLKLGLYKNALEIWHWLKDFVVWSLNYLKQIEIHMASKIVGFIFEKPLYTYKASFVSISVWTFVVSFSSVKSFSLFLLLFKLKYKMWVTFSLLISHYWKMWKRIIFNSKNVENKVWQRKYGWA